MTNTTSTSPPRDMGISIFGELLLPLVDAFDTIELVVFHDINGETIDYHSTIDPYNTRVAAAHYGLVFESTNSRGRWLFMGTVSAMTIYGNARDCCINRVCEDNYITVIARPGTVDQPKFVTLLKNTILELKKEAEF